MRFVALAAILLIAPLLRGAVAEESPPEPPGAAIPAGAGEAVAAAGDGDAGDEETATGDTGAGDAGDGDQEGDADEPPGKTVCELIEEAAAAHDLPVGFLTRLIWKESSFRPHAVSPKGAQGIAQFMPGTAALRRLADPFDPTEAIPASAHYLSDLRARFGNLGLAAAAYNSGEARVENWLAGSGGLPYETRDYVLTITGRTAEDWAKPEPDIVTWFPAVPAAAAAAEVAPPAAPQPPPAEASCTEVAALLARPGAGSLVVRAVEQGEWAPWGAQVAGGFSLDRAMASFVRLQGRHADVLGPLAPLVVRGVNKSRGRAPMFHIRLPAASREEAARLCQRLRSAGGPCVVMKN